MPEVSPLLQGFSICRSDLKQVLKKQRLKWSMDRYHYFLMQSHRLFAEQKTCLALWEAHVLEWVEEKALTYKGFWKAMKHVEPLWKHFFFKEASLKAQVKPGSLVILDTTLLSTKHEGSIRSKDHQAGNVTVRPLKRKKKAGEKPKKSYICGKKGFFMLLENGCIAHEELANINTYDGQWVAHPFWFVQKGYRQHVFLADAGFASREKRRRWKAANVSFKVENQLIMPYSKKSKTQLTPEEWAVYKNRWKIETLFQKLKHERGDFRLSLRWRKTESHQQAQFYWACWRWNRQH